MEKQRNREDKPTDSTEIKKNVQGQGQREQGQDAQDEFLDFDLDYKGDDLEENRAINGNKDKELVRKWEEIRQFYMIENPDLDEMDVTHGESEKDFDKMLERIGNKTGKNKEELRREIKNYEKK